MGKPCQLSAVEQQKIEQWIAAHGTPQQVALRCRIVSAAAADVYSYKARTECQTSRG